MSNNELRAARKYEREAKIKIRTALSQLAVSTEGRFFLQTLLSFTEHGEIVGPGNALEMAHINGRQYVGVMLINLMDEFSPSLYPSLLQRVREDAAEQQVKRGMTDE